LKEININIMMEKIKENLIVFLNPFPNANNIEPTDANHATTKTVVGASPVRFRIKIKAIQPIAAPARSAAYNLLIFPGNFVRTRVTTIPLKINGIETIK
jgi:hypothetical protein